MGFLDKAIDNFNPFADKKTNANKTTVVDRINQCKVIWYQWENELSTSPPIAFNLGAGIPDIGIDSDLAAARAYDISNHVESFTYTKSMNGAAGSFQLNLNNSFDWSRFMRGGQWMAVFLSGDGDLTLPLEDNTETIANSTKRNIERLDFNKALKGIESKVLPPLAKVPELNLPDGPDPEVIDGFKSKLRCLGIIQRVGIRSYTTQEGAVEITYSITGRDFGAILEDTEVWLNTHTADGKAYENLVHSITQEFDRNLTELLDKWYDIFLNPMGEVSKALSSVLKFFPKQWLLPNKLASDFKLRFNTGAGNYFGEINNFKEFSPTLFENPDPLPLAGLSGRCWERLKNCSQPEFHELFTELSDNGHPKLYFRPIPWAIDKSRYPTLGNTIANYADLASKDFSFKDFFSNLNPTAGLSKFASFDPLGIIDDNEDNRTKHSVNISALQVDTFDLGPDFHSRYNFFLVDANRSMQDQKSPFVILSQDPTAPYPLRNENDIKRHGFKPLFADLQSFNLISTSKFFGNQPQITFLKEANEVLKDYHANDEDFYSGTLNLAVGLNDIKLGKVIVTDDTVEGLKNMVFYIEGYTDTYSVDNDGTSSWTQSLNLTRGVQLDVLNGGSTKDRQATKPGTFHPSKK